MDDQEQTPRQHHWPVWMWFALVGSLLFLGPLAVVVWVAIGVTYFRQHPETTVRKMFLKRVAFLVGAVPAGFFALFVSGEMLTDPGGWDGVGLVALWALPTAALATAGWKAPRRSTGLFVGLTAVVIALGVWSAVDRDAWRSFEDDHGPVGAIVMFTVIGTTLFLAWRRPRLGGMLLLAVPVASFVLALIGGDASRVAVAVSAVGALPGVLFLLSEYYGARNADAPGSVEAPGTTVGL